MLILPKAQHEDRGWRKAQLGEGTAPFVLTFPVINRQRYNSPNIYCK
jgi:hypothetical protein